MLVLLKRVILLAIIIIRSSPIIIIRSSPGQDIIIDKTDEYIMMILFHKTGCK